MEVREVVETALSSSDSRGSLGTDDEKVAVVWAKILPSAPLESGV